MKTLFSIDISVTDMIIIQDALELSMIEILKDNTIDKENRLYCIGEREKISLEIQTAYEKAKANK